MNRNCPVCNKVVEKTLPDGKPNKYFPFCSQRCQLVDLGVWFDGRYSVASDPDENADPDQQLEHGSE